MNIRTVWLDGGQCKTGGPEQYESWKQQPDSLLWLDIQGGSAEQVKALLAENHVHELALRDTLRKRHPPKIESFEEHTFVLYRGMLQISEELDFVPSQLGLFIGDKLLITCHREAIKSINEILQENISANDFLSPAYLALSILHRSAGYYVAAILEFEDHLTELEDSLSASESADNVLVDLTIYKSRLLKLKRIFSYHVSISTALKANTHPFIDAEDEHLEHAIASLHERFERIHSLLCMYYEICGDLVDGYLSLTSHRMNLAMRVLTVITAIFVPLSFMVGLYGMNFDYMPELKFRYSYFMLLGMMVLISGSLLYIFRRKRWL